MVVYVARRIVFAVVTFVATTLVAFVLFHLIPIRFPAPNPPPLVVQYWYFLRDLVLHGSLGAGFFGRREINHLILQAAPVTASVVVGGVILWLFFSISLAIPTAIRAGSRFDRATLAFVVLGISVHPVWIGLMLSYFVGFKFGLTPIAGYCEPFNPPPGAFCGGVGDWLPPPPLPRLSLPLI